MDKSLINLLAMKLMISMKEYRKAEKRDPEYGRSYVQSLAKGLEETINELDQHGGVYHNHHLKMTAKMYWEDIIVTQIEMIGLFGGFELMQEVCDELSRFEDGNNYSNIFDILADGVQGWTT